MNPIYKLFFFLPIISFGITFLFIPFSKLLAQKFYIFDTPSKLSIHQYPTPRTGGIALFIGFCFGSVLLYYLLNNIVILEFLFFSFLFFLIGLYDDKFNLSPYIRLIYQIVFCSLFFYSFNVIKIINIYYLDYFLNVMLYTLFINSINFWDGMDGLAASTILFYLIILLIIALFINSNLIFGSSLIIIGAIFAFLIKNWHPSKLFMGDSGSYFLGSTIFLLIYEAVKLFPYDKSRFLFWIVILNLPFYDAVFAYFRRIMNRKPFAYGDRNHFYDLLLFKNIKQIHVLFISNIIVAIFGINALIVLIYPLFGIIQFSILFTLYLFYTIKIGSLRNF